MVGELPQLHEPTVEDVTDYEKRTVNVIEKKGTNKKITDRPSPT